jgi:hypothetical protein
VWNALKEKYQKIHDQDNSLSNKEIFQRAFIEQKEEVENDLRNLSDLSRFDDFMEDFFRAKATK